MVSQMILYPTEIQLNKANSFDAEAPFRTWACLSPQVIFADRPKVVLLLWIIFVVCVSCLSLPCGLVCFSQPCGHLILICEQKHQVWVCILRTISEPKSLILAIFVCFVMPLLSTKCHL